ncbi:MAG: hypothetical protein PHS97_05585 [Oscillospiraceae bacterium]|nr:hypothetical protein [Oscillospiraceae bacterium]
MSSQRPKYLIFTSDAEFYTIPCSGFASDQNILWSKSLPVTGKKRFSFLCKAHMSRTLAEKCRLPFQQAWYDSFINFKETDFSELKFVLFYESSRLSTNESYLRYLRKKIPNVPFLFYYTNLIDQKSDEFRAMVNRLYDRVLVYNKSAWIDNRKVFYLYGTYHTLETPQDADRTDIFFVGANKGRAKALNELYAMCTANGLKCDFTVLGVPEEARIAGINYTQKLPYHEVVRRIRRTKCILELFEGESGVTLRTMEAVCYHKLLISNQCYEGNEIPGLSENIIPIDTLASKIADGSFSQLDFQLHSGMEQVFCVAEFLQRITDIAL